MSHDRSMSNSCSNYQRGPVMIYCYPILSTIIPVLFHCYWLKSSVITIIYQSIKIPSMVKLPCFLPKAGAGCGGCCGACCGCNPYGACGCGACGCGACGYGACGGCGGCGAEGGGDLPICQDQFDNYC